MDKNKLFLTAKEVSEYLNIPLRTIQRLSKKGVIRSFKIGGKWKYLREDIEKYGSGFLTAKEVSGFFGIPLNTIYRYSRQGKIKSFKIGDQWRYLKSDIESYIAGNTDFSREQDIRPLQADPTRQNTAWGGFFEKRLHPRINSNFRCNYSINLPPFKNINNEAVIKNISAGGVFISNGRELMNKVGIDDPIDINFVLVSNGGNRTDISARGKIVRKTDNGLGVKFKYIDNEMKNKILEYAS